MEAVFLKLVNLSITASWLVLAVLLVRLVFRKMPKWIVCILWGLVALRLVCPVSIESSLSLIPSGEPIPPEFAYTAMPQIQSGIPAINSVVNPILASSMTPAPGASINPTQVLSFALSWIWLAGMVLMLLYAFISWILLRHRVAAATLFRGNVRQSEQVDSPFVLGFFKPTIYLPYRISEEDMDYVLAHEQAHIARRDHWWKPIGFLLLSVYWFNPILWVVYVLLCRDIEVACDEKVIRGMGKDDLRAYSTALLNCSVRHSRIAACPIAFGEVSVKGRIKNVMNYKKPAFWIIVVAIAACIVLAVCFMTNPEKAAAPYEWAHNISVEDIEEVTLVDSDRPLSQNEIISLVSLLNKLTNDNFTENSELPGGTPTYGLIIHTVDGNRYYVNKSIAPAGDLELNYGDKLWWIDNEELSAFIADAVSVKEGTLSLNDVIILSQKGEDLTWADFDGYAYTDIGSGLYIYRYEIDSLFSLMVGGTPSVPPIYIRLVDNRDDTAFIDIRTEDVEAFIAQRQSAAAISTAEGLESTIGNNAIQAARFSMLVGTET